MDPNAPTLNSSIYFIDPSLNHQRSLKITSPFTTHESVPPPIKSEQNLTSRNIDNRPAWMSTSSSDKTRRAPPSKRYRLWVIRAIQLSTMQSNSVIRFPLNVSNNLPAIKI